MASQHVILGILISSQGNHEWLFSGQIASAVKVSNTIRRSWIEKGLFDTRPKRTLIFQIADRRFLNSPEDSCILQTQIEAFDEVAVE